MKPKTAFKIYRHFLEPLVRRSLKLFLLLFRPLCPKKLQEIIQLKNEGQAHLSAFTFEEPPFWIHASSGEIEYAKPVIRELKRLYPGTPILVTFSSVSALPILQNIPELSSFSVLPWDTEDEMTPFLDRVRPRLLLVARTDVWPEMMEQVARRSIPSLLFAGTLVKTSRRAKGFGGGLSLKSFAQLSQIFCVSPRDLEVFKSLDPNLPLSVKGDTRFDQVLHRLRNPKKLKETLKPIETKNVLVAGSTWPEDDQILLRTLAENPHVRCIWSPHEVGEASLQRLEHHIKKQGLQSCRYSQSNHWLEPQILLVDQVGLLADLYSWGQMAFVGGSFRDKVHSVMEPLAAGKPVIVGPFFENNREAQDFSLIRFQSKSSSSDSPTVVSLVSRVLNGQQFGEKVRQLLALEDSVTKDLTNLILREVRSRSGSTAFVIDWVKSLER